MEIVIKIEESLYNTIMRSPNSPTLGWYAISHGTVLPKGHGRLIDANDVDNHIIGSVDLRDCPTIIEADKG